MGETVRIAQCYLSILSVSMEFDNGGNEKELMASGSQKKKKKMSIPQKVRAKNLNVFIETKPSLMWKNMTKDGLIDTIICFPFIIRVLSGILKRLL